MPPETSSINAFSASSVLEEIRALKAQRRKVGRLSKSRLDKFAYEIHSLRTEGAKPSEIQLWLRTSCRTKVSLSTVTRWLAKHEK